MYVLTAAVVLVAVLCLLDLLLTVGVIKRLREHTEIIAPIRQQAGIRTGDEVGEFSVLSVDGEPLGRESLTDDSVVAFFAPDCQPCKAVIPDFIRLAKADETGRDHRIAVVIGEASASGELVAMLRPFAQVIVEEPLGAVSTAFRTSATPTVLRVGNLRGRTVVTSDRVLAAPTAAAV
ncbi:MULTISPECIES: TlpA family protein disulfide reductase [unclassified Streptomyces]|uniref:TlpA family protein disulfide reductase n=1 Tax=unclassified Streptomyces TaxID=2593676 RepID=UPI0037F785B4